MNHFAIAVLSLRILAIYAFMQAILTFDYFRIIPLIIDKVSPSVGSFSGSSISTLELSSIFSILIPPIFILLFSIILWTQAVKLAYLILPNVSFEDSEESFDWIKIQVLAIGLAGIFIIINTLSRFSNITVFFRYPSVHQIPAEFYRQAMVGIAILAIKLSIGLGMLFRAKAVVRMLNRQV